jgi:hypothetical protein
MIGRVVASPDGTVAVRDLEEWSWDGDAVELGHDAAIALARRYERDIQRSTAGMVRGRFDGDGMLTLRLLGRLVLLRLGPLAVQADPVSCRVILPVEGGLMARRPGGRLELGLAHAGPGRLRGWCVVEEFRPLLPPWPYRLVQLPVHQLITRRFLARLAADLARADGAQALAAAGAAAVDPRGGPSSAGSAAAR